MKVIKGNSNKSQITRGLMLQVGQGGVLILDETNVAHMFNNFKYCKTTDMLDSITVLERKLPPDFLDEIHHVVFITMMVNMDTDVINKLLRLEAETGKQFYLQMNDFRMNKIEVYDLK